MFAMIATPMAAPQMVLAAQASAAEVAPLPASRAQAQAMTQAAVTATATPPLAVPFFSQFSDIESSTWQQVSCGITSLAMLIDFYEPDAISADALLRQGIAAGAYNKKKGWSFGGLIGLSEQYGLQAAVYDFSKLSAKSAKAKFMALLADGPVMLSVHNKFNPKSKLPHLVVVNRIEDGTAFINDPAATSGPVQISATKLFKSWQKKGIAVRPAAEKATTTAVAVGKDQAWTAYASQAVVSE